MQLGVKIIKGDEAKAISQEAEKHLQKSTWRSSEGEPVVLHVISSSQEPILLEPKDGQRITIVAEENSETIVTEKNGKGKFSVDILLKNNAKMKYHSASNAKIQRFAFLQRDANIEWIDAAYGEAESEIVSYLAEDGANAEFKSVFLGRGEEHYDIKSSMIHAGSHSTSNMLTRAVLFDRSKGKYEGLIRILPNAKGCDAYQKENTLLLSDKARMDATPNLEINNEEVRCSHGVSLGQIDEEKIFYFLSRGIPRNEAENLIVHGFFDEILNEMHGDIGKMILSRVKND